MTLSLCAALPHRAAIPIKTDVAGSFFCKPNATTYVDHSGPNSPLIEDCKQLVRDLEAGQIQLCYFDRCTVNEIPFSFRTCHISIETVAPDNDCQPMRNTIGSGDIIEYINGAIQRFSRPDGRVAASGENLCFGWICICTHAQWNIY